MSYIVDLGIASTVIMALIHIVDDRITRINIAGLIMNVSAAFFLRDLTQKLSLKRLHLAGNSLGGRIAFEYALKHSQDVIKLVLINSGGYKPDSVPMLMLFVKFLGLNMQCA